MKQMGSHAGLPTSVRLIDSGVTRASVASCSWHSSQWCGSRTIRAGRDVAKASLTISNQRACMLIVVVDVSCRIIPFISRGAEPTYRRLPDKIDGQQVGPGPRVSEATH